MKSSFNPNKYRILGVHSTQPFERLQLGHACNLLNARLAIKTLKAQGYKGFRIQSTENGKVYR